MSFNLLSFSHILSLYIDWDYLKYFCLAKLRHKLFLISFFKKPQSNIIFSFIIICLIVPVPSSDDQNHVWDYSYCRGAELFICNTRHHLTFNFVFLNFISITRVWFYLETKRVGSPTFKTHFERKALFDTLFLNSWQF